MVRQQNEERKLKGAKSFNRLIIIHRHCHIYLWFWASKLGETKRARKRERDGLASYSLAKMC